MAGTEPYGALAVPRHGGPSGGLERPGPRLHGGEADDNGEQTGAQSVPSGSHGHAENVLESTLWGMGWGGTARVPTELRRREEEELRRSTPGRGPPARAKALGLEGPWRCVKHRDDDWLSEQIREPGLGKSGSGVAVGSCPILHTPVFFSPCPVHVEDPSSLPSVLSSAHSVSLAE